jgi:hypothetical protein
MCALILRSLLWLLLGTSMASANDNIWQLRYLDCAALLHRASQSVLTQPPQVTVAMEDLHPAVRQWLKLRRPIKTDGLNGKMPLPEGTLIEFQEQKLPILYVLGGGSEGFTYLVQTPKGLRVVKAFHKDIDFGYYTAEHLKAGNRVPKINAIDKKGRMLLLDYWEGISIAEIKFYAGALSFPDDFVGTIKTRFREWQLSQDNSWWPWAPRAPNSENGIYSFKLDDFYQIDPD